MNRMRINTLLLLLCIFLPGMAQDVSDGWNKNKTTRLAKPVFVYNNWSAYGKLSDSIPLNKTLAMKELDHIARLKKIGVQVDYYLMGAFWFDVNERYRKWRLDCWPRGPKRWLDAYKREGIKPGLWFSTDLLRIDGGADTVKVIPEWEGSVAKGGVTLCLFRGGYSHHFMQTLQIYADMGIKIFKSDFAYFDAATLDARCTMLPTDIEEQNKNAFISAIKEFRYRNPDILLIGYDGFGGGIENTVTSFRKTIGLCWLEIFDMMYCGDPRLSDVPMMNFWRSQDLYSDHMTSQYLFSGVPVQHIDNCASMTGTTGTCYNGALNAWKGMMILTMACGGWLNVCHGNIDLLSDNDTCWMVKVQQLYMKVQQYGDISTFGSIPSEALPYGYMASAEGGDLYTVVDAPQEKVEVTLPEATGTGRVLFTNSGLIPVLEKNTVELGPKQMAVVGYGKFGTRGYDLGTERNIVIPATIRKVKIDVQKKSERILQTHYASSKRKTVRTLFQQLDERGKAFRSWGGTPPTGAKTDRFFSIKAKQGKHAVPVKESYDKMIWCGLSWAVGEVSADDMKEGHPLEVDYTTIDENSEHCLLEVYEAEYSADKK